MIIVDGELWTYAAGLWQPFDEHTLRTYIHQAARYVKSVGAATLNGAYRWIAEDIALVRHGVQWDRAGVIVGTNGALDLRAGLLVAALPGPLRHARRRLRDRTRGGGARSGRRSCVSRCRWGRPRPSRNGSARG